MLLRQRISGCYPWFDRGRDILYGRKIVVAGRFAWKVFDYTGERHNQPASSMVSLQGTVYLTDGPVSETNGVRRLGYEGKDTQKP